MTYGTVDPEQLLMANRTRTPTLEELAEQVTMLTRLLVNNGFTATSTVQQLAVGAFERSQKLTKVPRIVNVTDAYRDLETSFQVSAVAPALVIYTVQLKMTGGLLDEKGGWVDLLCDAADPPTTVVAPIYLSLEQLAGATSVAMRGIIQKSITALVPAGYHVLLHAHGDALTAKFISGQELIFE